MKIGIVLPLAMVVGLGLGACTPAEMQKVDRVLTMSAAACVRIAQAKGRTDIAAYCGLAGDALPVLEAALDNEGSVCPTTPVQPADAGVGE